jgi:DNA-binding MarR family transcriptional regulator
LTEIAQPLGYLPMADEETATPFGPALLAVAGHWREEFRAQMVASGFAAAAGTGGEALTHLASAGLPQTVLTQRLGLSKQAVQQVLDALEAEGLVQRSTDPSDKRVKQVALTARGTLALATRQAAETRLEDDWRDRLGKKSFKKLRKALRDLAPPGR